MHPGRSDLAIYKRGCSVESWGRTVNFLPRDSGGSWVLAAVVLATAAGAGACRGGERQSSRRLARRPFPLWASGETTVLVLHKRARSVDGSWGRTVNNHACVVGVSRALAVVAIAATAGAGGRRKGERPSPRRLARRP